MKRFFTYDPGSLPTKPAPRAGQRVQFRLDGLPPFKDTKFSIRNSKHKHHRRFVALQAAAIEAMAGRAWSHDPIGLDVEIHAPSFETRRRLVDYVGGIMDSLDGSHGTHFTYLSIVYNVDCQVCSGESSFYKSQEEWYTVRLIFSPPLPRITISGTGLSPVVAMSLCEPDK